MIDYSIVGRRFGRLTVIKLDHIDPKYHSTWWRCKCDCGEDRLLLATLYLADVIIPSMLLNTEKRTVYLHIPYIPYGQE